MFTSSHRSSAAPERNAGHLALGDARKTSAEAHAIKAKDGRARKCRESASLRQQRNHFRHLPAALAPQFQIATASARAEPRRDAAKRPTTRRRPNHLRLNSTFSQHVINCLTRCDATRRDKTLHDATRRDATRRDADETRRDETETDETRRDETRRDETEKRREEKRRARRDETR